MTNLLQWATNEVTCVPVANFCKVKIPKDLPIGEDVNEDILIEDEIANDYYCSQCDKMVSGINCGWDRNCPWQEITPHENAESKQI